MQQKGGSRGIDRTVVVHELYNVLKQNENCDRKRFVAALKQLPKLPYDEDG